MNEWRPFNVIVAGLVFGLVVAPVLTGCIVLIVRAFRDGPKDRTLGQWDCNGE